VHVDMICLITLNGIDLSAKIVIARLSATT
jgi:hypothetical protein